MDLLTLLFSFKGRIPRSTWWAFLVASLVVAILVVVIALPAIRGIGLIGILLVFSVFWAALLWVSFAVGAKRLHDRDRTGWWQAIPILIGTLASVLAFEAVFPALIGVSFKGLGTVKELDAAKELGSAKELGTAVQLLDLVNFGFGIWLFVEMGFLRGTRGPNRFGPDPLGNPEADAQL